LSPFEDLSNELATKLSRLGAFIIDTFIIMAALVPLMFLMGYFDDFSEEAEDSILFDMILTLASFVIFLLLNFNFLLSNGQTIGKKATGIKIVNLHGGKIDTATIFKRYGFYYLIVLIPGVGDLLSLIDVLCIFGREQRCLHDLVGETKVVKCR